MDCGKRQAKKSDNPLSRLSVLEMRSRIKEQNIKVKGLSKLNRSDLCKIIKQNRVLQLSYLVNQSNSCYINSLLTAFFFNKHKFINQKLVMAPIAHKHKDLVAKAEEIRGSLKVIRDAIQSPSKARYSCNNLRKLFTDFDKLYRHVYPDRIVERINWQRDQCEPLDVLAFLYRVFDIHNTVGFKNRLEPFSHLGVFTGSLESLHLKSEFEPYSQADYMYVAVNRGYQGDIKSKTQVIAPASVKLSNQDQRLKLRAVLVHLGERIRYGHYVSILKVKNRWVLYDDMRGYETLDMTTKELLKSNYFSNCIGLVYST